jgi:hypothetical protein
MSSSSNASRRLLAVDLGLKMGYALFDENGHLQQYQARKISGRAQLKTAIYRILKEWAPAVLYLEGGGDVAGLWIRQATKMKIPVTQVHAMAWREDLLLQRQRKSGKDAKRHAAVLAIKIIDWSGAHRATSMRHDVAETIVFGLWAVVQEGWLPEIPKELT